MGQNASQPERVGATTVYTASEFRVGIADEPLRWVTLNPSWLSRNLLAVANTMARVGAMHPVGQQSETERASK